MSKEHILDGLNFISQPLIYIIKVINVLTYVAEHGGLFASYFDNVIDKYSEKHWNNKTEI